MTPRDRALCAGSSISFNRVLCSGATVYPWLVAEQGFAGLAEWLHAEAITVFIAVPSVFRNFAAALSSQHRFPHLRRFVLTGETLYRKDVMLFREHFSHDCILVNELGSSETKSYAQYVVDGRDPLDCGDIVPVGFALEGRQVLLLDADGVEVGQGQVGEIAVRSRHLSPGYWRRPDLTRLRFRADPDSRGERIYHTGDLAYRLADGRLVHVGRKDSQLKIRGQRTELAEVEAVLRHLDGVQEAVVVAATSCRVTGDSWRTSFPSARSRLTASDLALGLKEQLPDYMIPASFMVLDALPMTPNGKIDRLALPAPLPTRPDLANPYAAPRDAVEETLARLWSEVLDIERVGIHDDFFELGGDSLRATMVQSRIAESFRVTLPLRDLLRLANGRIAGPGDRASASTAARRPGRTRTHSKTAAVGRGRVSRLVRPAASVAPGPDRTVRRLQ